MTDRRLFGPAPLFALLLAAVATPAAPAAAQRAPSSERCVSCHLEQDDERLAGPARSFEKDVHAENGFGCLDCHGHVERAPGAPPDAKAGFLARPARGRIPALCGRCHADAAFMKRYNPSMRVDQLQEYATSTHGRLLREKNDPEVATCVDCHPAHATRPPSDPASSVHPLNVAETCGSCHADAERMAPRGIPADQLEAYRASVHGRLMAEGGDLSAPTCNDCHGNHGAAPPGIESVHRVCGECHATMDDYFAASGHDEPFSRSGLPGCVTCHGNHAVEEADDRSLLAVEDQLCGRCHPEPDPAGREFTAMLVLLDSLDRRHELSREILERAENAGMEVSQALFALQDVNNAATRARAAVHSFRRDTVAKEVAAGLAVTAAAHERGREALAEHRFRRAGLALSVTLILVLIAALARLIRWIETPDEAPGPNSST